MQLARSLRNGLNLVASNQHSAVPIFFWNPPHKPSRRQFNCLNGKLESVYRHPFQTVHHLPSILLQGLLLLFYFSPLECVQTPGDKEKKGFLRSFLLFVDRGTRDGGFGLDSGGTLTAAFFGGLKRRKRRSRNVCLTKRAIPPSPFPKSRSTEWLSPPSPFHGHVF